MPPLGLRSLHVDILEIELLALKPTPTSFDVKVVLKRESDGARARNDADGYVCLRRPGEETL
jgi:hypothetical protein